MGDLRNVLKRLDNNSLTITDDEYTDHTEKRMNEVNKEGSSSKSKTITIMESISHVFGRTM